MKLFLQMATVSLVMTGACSALAAALSTIPMQGSMVMPMVSYHADTGALTAHVDPAVVQLTPLLASNPNDAFNSSDPWFADLDAAAKGLCFSRRYGFVMGASSDPLPPGAAMRIRMLEKSEGLLAFRYRSNPPVWEPIFGTAGASPVFAWDGTMFHPTFAARPGTNSFVAHMEAFLVNAASEQPLPGGNAGPFTLSFTNTPDPRPSLIVAAGQIRWPESTNRFALQSCDDLLRGQWTDVASAPAQGNGTAADLPTSPGSRYYRLVLRR